MPNSSVLPATLPFRLGYIPPWFNPDGTLVLPAGTTPGVGPFDLLDGNRVTRYRFDLLGSDETLLGTIGGVEGAGGYLEWHAYASIKGAGRLPVRDLVGDINWTTVRVRPWSLISGLNTSGPTLEVPLGVYLPAAPAEKWAAMGRSWDVELADKCSILDQDIPVDADGNPYTYAAAAGSNVVDLVVDLIQGAGEDTPAIQPGDKALGQDMVWEIGTTRLKIANDLLAAADYASLWCDGLGQFRIDEYVEPQDRQPVYNGRLVFSKSEQSLMVPDWGRDRDISDVPNRYVAVSQGTQEGESLVAYATNEDPSSPFSYSGRGNRWITRTVTDTDAIGPTELLSRARRGLSQASSITSGLKVEHPFLPDVQVNRVVPFVNPDAGLDILCVITATTVPLEPTAMCKSELREIVVT